MSYDLTIRSDEHFSERTPKAALESFIAQLPHVKQNGSREFVLDDETTKRWMEIDLEVLTMEVQAILTAFLRSMALGGDSGDDSRGKIGAGDDGERFR